MSSAPTTRDWSESRVGYWSGARWRECAFWVVSFPVVLGLVVLTVMFAMCRQNILDPDIWWHLHNAEYLVQNHRLPSADLYSFTVPGEPWMNHEWLAEMPYYFAWKLGGLSGINAVTILTLALIFLGVVYLSYQETGHYKASIVAVCAAVFLGSVSFGPRTILFGYSYLVVLLVVLQRLRQKGHAPLWIFPILFCVWVNTHGSWLVGMVVFSMIAAAGMLSGEWGLVVAERWTKPQRKRVLISWIASVGALFVNPFGARLVLYPFDLAFRQKLNIEHVAEWVSVNFHDLRGKLVLGVLLVLIISSLLRPRRWRLAEIALVAFALYSGLTYTRFLFLAGIILAPVLAKSFDCIPSYRRELDTPFVNAVVIVLIIAGIVHFWPRKAQLQEWVSTQYPVQAADYLEKHPPGGRVLNLYMWGGYLNWRDPSVKVFIDGRADIFEYKGVLKDYLDVIGLDHPDVVLSKYNIEYVLVPPQESVASWLEKDTSWTVVYQDKTSLLIGRKQNADVAFAASSATFEPR